MLAQGRSLSVKGVDSELKDFRVGLTADESGGLLKLTADRLDGELRASWPNLLSDPDLAASLLEEATLQGRFRTTDLPLGGRFPAEDKPGVQPTLFGGRLNADVTFGGRLGRPVIGGLLAVRGGDISLGGPFEAAPGGGSFPIEPVFDNLVVRVEDGSQVRFALGEIGLAGEGSLDGALAALNLRVPLQVQRGRLQLPNARINLDSGLVDLNFRGDAGYALRIDVDLEGQTSLTARRTADQFETYQVDLGFRGDLLDPNGLQITATADPGDLGQDEILALLGQRDLIEALAGSALRGGGASALRDPLYQLALPSLTQGLTGRLAESLRLDYLALEYNAFDQALVRFGDSLGNGFFLQGWRQLSEPAAGPARYDFRLSYRLPFRRELDRFRLGFGTTHDRPWRISLDWSRRF
ncbi:MAG: translocation/assembly module TamB [Fimbriimonadaceae bacterium]|nr:translocation/assembly module TamB [Fimbriimonadaceae bacterium]